VAVFVEGVADEDGDGERAAEDHGQHTVLQAREVTDRDGHGRAAFSTGAALG
jgi:hypothetical protein